MDKDLGYFIDDPRHGAGPPEDEAIWQLLLAADEEFVPPLSTRESTTQAALRPATQAEDDAMGEGPVQYFEALQDQQFILAREKRSSAVVGFLSFRAGHRLPAPAPEGHHLYVSTVIVGRDHRRRGITRAMYQRLLAEAALLGQGVATRTWSTNTGHLRLLEQIGIAEVLRLPDHRGTGIDTLYLARAPRNRSETA